MQMRKMHLWLLVFPLLLGFAFISPSHFYIRAVFDGDTILLKNGEKVRYAGIDAPEMGETPEFMAFESREMNHHLVSGARIRLESDKVRKDRYGRRLAYVFVENGEMVNLILVRRGLAHVLVNGADAKYFSKLLESQRGAMTDGIGIWSKQIAVPEVSYLGNTGSFVFHRPSCVHAKEVSRRNRHSFATRRDAFWEGFHPCRVCKP